MREDGAVGAPDDEVEESVTGLRRRADELAVLNDLARRLAALHDTREVLDEVARQARRLLGVDVAYIMLLRADRLRIEVVDGAMGSAMRGIELESGQGLGGQVLATGRPLTSDRYLEDARFPHGQNIDEAARVRAQAAFDEIISEALACGGTVTGEHGVGLLKRDGLAAELSPAVVEMHRAIRRALDPHGVLNPGKVVV